MSCEIIGQNVSRETYDKLLAYEALIQKWNPSINLVAKSTLSEVWTRHIIDSAQVYFSAMDEKSSIWTDIGSGGGLPGIVIATLAQGDGQQIGVTMVESDKRKSVFLRTAIRELGLTETRVINERIESAQIRVSDIVTARALCTDDRLARRNPVRMPPAAPFTQIKRESGCKITRANALRPRLCSALLAPPPAPGRMSIASWFTIIDVTYMKMFCMLVEDDGKGDEDNNIIDDFDDEIVWGVGFKSMIGKKWADVLGY